MPKNQQQSAGSTGGSGSSRKPDVAFRAGKFKVAIWSQQKQADGNTWTEYSGKLTKSYRDKDGTWHDYEIPIFLNEMPIAISLLQQVFGQFGVGAEFNTGQDGGNQ
jgi:hypothetical protein